MKKEYVCIFCLLFTLALIFTLMIVFKTKKKNNNSNLNLSKSQTEIDIKNKSKSFIYTIPIMSSFQNINNLEISNVGLNGKLKSLFISTMGEGQSIFEEPCGSFNISIIRKDKSEPVFQSSDISLQKQGGLIEQSFEIPKDLEVNLHDMITISLNVNAQCIVHMNNVKLYWEVAPN
jgi:hypothetical protein